MAFALGTEAERRGYRLESFAEVGSTNAEAIAAARAGDPGRTWFVSSHQTAGRGRRGRAWATPPGNLAATLLVIGRRDPGAAASLGFVAGLALDEALRRVAPSLAVRVALDGMEPGAVGEGARLRLKWPNDVLLDGAKLAGILLEGEALPGGDFAVAIGIGVNVTHAPVGLPYPAVALQGLGIPVDAETLFAALSNAWAGLERMWAEGRGFTMIRRLWLERAAGLGERVAVQMGGETLSGTFETIDETGRLVVALGDGTRRTVAAGEVHFGAVATVRA
jgi:BirA family biotin operon repressor/biotin-[acetyl-CoA-carboxylase] ligase